MTFRWRFHLSIFVLATSITAMISKLLLKHINSVQLISFSIDSRLSNKTQKEVIQFFEHKKKSNALWNVQDVQNKFPYIDQVHIRQGINEVHFDLQAIDPIAIVNHEYVVTKAQRIVSKNIFKAVALNSLPSISWPSLNTDRISDHFLKTVAYVNNAIAHTHEVIWIDEQTMELRDKYLEDFSIICNAQSLPTQEVFALCKQIYLLKKTSIREKKCSATRKHEIKNHIVADVRFKKQIICKST